MSVTKRLLLVSAFLLIVSALRAAYFENIPYTIKQPDGKSIKCFISGDEFYNWIHDEEGYTFIQAPDGYYYYAEKDGEKIKPSKYRVQSVSPKGIGLTRWIKISSDEYQRRRDEVSDYLKSDKASLSKAPRIGIINNIIIYIRFSDDVEFSTPRSIIDNRFNLSPGESMKSYFNEVSYNKLTINSTHYPQSDLSTNLSYQDAHPRSYFQPYNETTNPGGYKDSSEKLSRERTLLTNAITWINNNSPVPATINIDEDGNNYVDNLCFIIKGSPGSWNDLLWGHRSSLGSQTIKINGKTPGDYTFQPEDQVNVRIICHEMFHVLGAPDLYHYNSGSVTINPAGTWDLMEYGNGHMLAYMKWKYTGQNWISSIPEITSSGMYTLKPLTSPDNNCFKIASPNSGVEFFMVEYRRKTGTFEKYLPGSGLIVYRIDTRRTGNSNGPPDEVYVYRPNGTLTSNGSYNNAFFSSSSGRTIINDGTNPSGFLQDGSMGGLNISNISDADSTITFYVSILPGCTPPATQASGLTAASVTNTTLNLSWLRGNGNAVIVIGKAEGAVNVNPVNGTIYKPDAAFGNGSQLGTGNFVIYKGTGTSVNVTRLLAGTNYYFAVYELDTTKYCYKTPALTGSIKTQGTSTYCSAGSVATINEYISSVVMGSINQSSGRGTAGYEDFTQRTTNLQIGVNVSARITVSNPQLSDQILIWIDWNKDNDFTDVGEDVYSSAGNFSSPHTTSIFMPPSDAITGTTRMRIRLQNTTSGSNSTPCGNSAYGEVEDYSVNILPPSCISPSVQATAFSFSSITASEMTIGWTRGNGSAVIVVARASGAVNSNPSNGTTYIANAAFGTGTKIGTNNYVVYNGTGNSVNITGLTSETTYYFSVYEYNSATNCYMNPALSGSATTAGNLTYCPAGSPSTINEYISKVVIGSVIQPSERGFAGYQDFTSLSAIFQPGVNTSVAVTVSNPFSTDQIIIWIDWNNDNDFTDTGETVYSSAGSFITPLTTTIFTIPAGAVPGITRMRIRLHNLSFGPNATPCGNSDYGEVEDYSINIIAKACSPPASQATGFISSLATSTSITSGWTRGNGDGVIVMARAGSAVNEIPVSGISYTANAVFGSGATQIGTGNYVVYKGTGNSVNITGLLPGTTYYFAIFEYYSSGNCYNTIGLTGSVKTLCETQAAPVIGTVTHPSCQVSTGSVVLNGLPVTGTWTLIRNPGGTMVNGTGTNSIISGLIPGTYSFTVTNASGCTSVPSSNVTINPQPAIPAVPEIYKSSGITQTGFTANWGSSATATGYRLDISADAGFINYVPGFNDKNVGGVTSYSVSGLNANTTYYYRVRASNLCGNTSNSLVSSSKTLSNPSSVPEGLTSSSCNDLVTLKWRKSTGQNFLRYRIYGSSEINPTIKTDSTSSQISDTFRIISGLKRGLEYYFRVTAVNYDGVESNYSDQSSVIVKTGIVPKIKSKWSDMLLICYNPGDSIKSYQWYKGSNPISNATIQYYRTGNQKGEYLVETVDREGCRNSSNIITVSGTKGLSVYPNPASTYFSLTLNDDPEGKTEISLINSFGVILSKIQTEKTGKELNLTIPVNTLPDGVYQVQIQMNDNNVYYTQIVVLK